MATTYGSPWGGNTSGGNWWTYTSGTTTSTVSLYPTVVAAPGSTVEVHPSKPKKQTALEWLDAEVERICALTRAGLVPA